ncbi:MAG: amidohydrolase [Firmicutes bacterium]|nr:amidohydrolase [Bacillota bacterium]
MAGAAWANHVQEIDQDVRSVREHLHAHPELSFQEHATAAFVSGRLQQIPGLELQRPTPTSIVARVRGRGDGRTVALRADMDALPIEEESGVDFSSQAPGVMHACGHDAHTAMLYGAARILAQMRDRWNGELRFFFQHAEELLPGGAQEMVAAGVMDGVDAVTGLHVRSQLPVGVLRVGAGPMSAVSDKFYITVRGKGGHAAHPHQTVDPIAIGAQIVTNLQHIVARNFAPQTPAVVSVTRFVSGTAPNIIPESAELWGTVRLLDISLRAAAQEQLTRIARDIASAHGATCDIRYAHGYAPVVNDDAVTAAVRAALVEEFGEQAIEPAHPGMGGEDFSAFQTRAPGTFFYLGGASPEEDVHYPHHHPRFRVDNRALALGARAHVAVALKLLGD